MLRALVLLMAVAAAACGSDSSPSGPSMPAAPYSQTDLVVGTGAEAQAGSFVSVHYTGWLYDPAQPESKGAQFDTSAVRGPFMFRVGAGSVIRGWDQGVPGMRVGGQRRLIIPPNLGYGSSPNGSIPGNSTLVFDIELLAVN